MADTLCYIDFGHALPFFIKNSTSLYAAGKKYSDKSTAPFMLYAEGESFVVITAPTDVSTIFNDNVSFPFDSFIDTVYRGVGDVSEKYNELLWWTPKEGFASFWPEPKDRVLVHTGNSLLHKQLLQPALFHQLSGMILKYIEEGTRWDGFSETFFGDYFLELEPRMTQLFDDWDIEAWIITYQFPGLMARLATKPGDKLIKALAQYLDAPRERRAGGVRFVNELGDEERNAGLCSENCARILMIILWGVNSNVQMTTFWTVAHILARPDLLARIRHEVAPVMEKLEPLENASRDAMVNLTKSDLVEACPLLDSAVNEVLRMSSTGSSVRKVVKSVNIAGKDLPVGVKVFLPQRPLLLSTQGFGPDAQEVDLLRFLKNKALSRHEYYRPFDGGITMCSGKALGKREIMVFVVLAIWKYDIEVLLPGQRVMGVERKDFPRLDERKPSIGVAKQVKGDDMIVKVSPRKR